MNGVYVAGMPLHSIFDLVLGDEGTTVHLEMFQNTGKLLTSCVFFKYPMTHDFGSCLSPRHHYWLPSSKNHDTCVCVCACRAMTFISSAYVVTEAAVVLPLCSALVRAMTCFSCA